MVKLQNCVETYSPRLKWVSPQAMVYSHQVDTFCQNRKHWDPHTPEMVLSVDWHQWIRQNLHLFIHSLKKKKHKHITEAAYNNYCTRPSRMLKLSYSLYTASHRIFCLLQARDSSSNDSIQTSPERSTINDPAKIFATEKKLIFKHNVSIITRECVKRSS